MKTKLNFTKAALDSSACPAGKDRLYFYDLKAPGLAMCVTSTGAKSFYFYKWSNGRPVRTRMGGYPELTIEQARKCAVELAASVARGTDPQEAKRAARAAETFGDLFTRYMEQHAKIHKRGWQGDQDQYDRYLSPWSGRIVKQIAQGDVRALHTRIGTDHGPYAANRLLSLLHAVYSKTNTAPNPAHGVRRFKEQQRERFLHPDELPAFFQALDTEPNDLIRDFVLLSL